MNGLEKRLRERVKRFDYPIDITEHDLNARYLIGWPGYRTARDKSGLGYVETQAELGHMYGLFIKWLVTGKFRTRNPVYLLGMAILGILCGGMPLLFIVHEVVFYQNWYILVILISSPYIPCGLLLLVNVFLSIINWGGKTITGD